jgi:HD superfamily phosphohydrolase
MKKSIQAVLTENFIHPIRDVLWGHIYLTDEMAELTASAPFMRLNRIMQLGPVYLAYPGATHTRASHSIGVYHLGRRLMQNLAERGAGSWLSEEGIMSFLCACLLHDLGHFPYTHSLKELPLSSHEQLTAEIILTEPMKSLVSKTGADPELCAAIIDKEMNTDGIELRFYRKLLSGALDPDKLDYLNRDARYCGVPYGAQDVDFILSRLHPHKERGVDIDSRLIPNVEAVLFSKYLMYRTVYWHKQVRSATAMVKKALISALKSGVIRGKDLYNLDDMSLFTLLREKTRDTLCELFQQGKIYIMAAELPFHAEMHESLKNIDNRSNVEHKLAEKLKLTSNDIIIDIGEPLSFDTGLFVEDENRNFSESSSAFSTGVINSFIQTLFTIRIFINQEHKKIMQTLPRLNDILCDIIEKG